MSMMPMVVVGQMVVVVMRKRMVVVVVIRVLSGDRLESVTGDW